MFFLKDLPVTGQTVTDNSQVSVWLLSFRVFFISFWSNFKLTESLVTCQHLHVRDVHVVAVTEPTKSVRTGKSVCTPHHFLFECPLESNFITSADMC